MNTYKFYILNLNKITITISYFNVESFILPKLPQELSEFQRYFINKDWGTISKLPRTRYREFLGLSVMHTTNNNRLVKFRNLFKYIETLYLNSYIFVSHTNVPYKNFCAYVNILIFPIVKYLRPLLFSVRTLSRDASYIE